MYLNCQYIWFVVYDTSDWFWYECLCHVLYVTLLFEIQYVVSLLFVRDKSFTYFVLRLMQKMSSLAFLLKFMPVKLNDITASDPIHCYSRHHFYFIYNYNSSDRLKVQKIIMVLVLSFVLQIIHLIFFLFKHGGFSSLWIWCTIWLTWKNSMGVVFCLIASTCCQSNCN